MNNQPSPVAEEAKGISVLSLAEPLTELHHEGPGEYSGPCPKCGGEDRFHVREEWFFCRHCHPKRGDAPGLLMWFRGMSYPEAVKALTGKSIVLGNGVKASPRPQDGQQSVTAHKFDSIYWSERMDAAQRRLAAAGSGEAGREYLRLRGLRPSTWGRFGFGFEPDIPVPGTDGEIKVPAIAIPWYRGGRLAAIRYRFLEAVDRDGKKVKQTSRGGFRGLFWGGMGLLGLPEPLPEDHKPVERFRTLVICEGEINAASIWQEAHPAGVDVLSLGSESQSLTDLMRSYVVRYGQILVWMDSEYWRDKLAEVTGANGRLMSVDGKDANDRLRDGSLQALIMAWRIKTAGESAEQLERILWDYWDAWQRGEINLSQPGHEQLMALAGRLDKSL